MCGSTSDWSDPALLSPTEKIQLGESDIISFHDYSWPETFEKRIVQLETLHRPILCTEYMARGAGSTFDESLPIAAKHHVGAINWGLVQGLSQTYLPWDSWKLPYTDREPTVWFHDVFYTNGKPYRQAEADEIKRISCRAKRHPHRSRHSVENDSVPHVRIRGHGFFPPPRALHAPFTLGADAHFHPA